jgi:IS6 family transposase
MEVSTDRAPAYPRVLDELLPSGVTSWSDMRTIPSKNDHGRSKVRLRPMRGLKQIRSVISVGHAFIQNVRRGHYELATDVDPRQRLATAFAELALAV